MTLGKNTRNGKGNRGARASGEGPDEAEVKGWRYKGKVTPLSGGGGLFTFTDRQGRTQTTHRFKPLKKRDS